MKLETIKKKLSAEEIEVIQNDLSAEDLREVIVDAERNISKAQEELDANPQYIELKESMKAIRSGFTEVKGRQAAKISLALMTLDADGKNV